MNNVKNIVFSVVAILMAFVVPLAPMVPHHHHGSVICAAMDGIGGETHSTGSETHSSGSEAHSTGSESHEGHRHCSCAGQYVAEKNISRVKIQKERSCSMIFTRNIIEFQPDIYNQEAWYINLYQSIRPASIDRLRAPPFLLS